MYTMDEHKLHLKGHLKLRSMNLDELAGTGDQAAGVASLESEENMLGMGDNRHV